MYISDSQLSDDGSQVTVTVAYMADEANLSGIGLAVDFDSSVFTVNSISDVFAGAIANGEQSGNLVMTSTLLLAGLRYLLNSLALKLLTWQLSRLMWLRVLVVQVKLV